MYKTKYGEVLVSFKIPEDRYKTLKQCAKNQIKTEKKFVSVSDLIREAIANYLQCEKP